MKEEITKAVIIGIAIILGAVLHAGITRDIGRFQVYRTATTPPLRIDTMTGDLYGPDGKTINQPLSIE